MVEKKLRINKAPPKTGGGYELWRSFAYTYRLFNTIYSKQLRQYDLSPEIAATVGAIYHSDHAPCPSELARQAGRKPQTINTIIKKMEARGLVEKQVNENKKNVGKLVLTPKGTSAYLKSININLYDQFWGALPDEKKKLFHELLDEILSNNIRYFSRMKLR
jgi:DNA-binding MarR family transcriptional regulator